MGWSCTALADDTLRDISLKHFNNTNFKRIGDLMVMFEVGREQQNGSITGYVEMLKQYENDNTKFHTLKRSNLKISPNGEIVKFPKWALK